MELLKFWGKIITPVFSGNAFGKKQAEFRPPEIKWLLSYWWRAINPQLVDQPNWKETKLYNYGHKIFGGEYEEGGETRRSKSKISIVSFRTNLKKFEGKDLPKMVPHKVSGIPMPALEEQDFCLSFKDPGVINFDGEEIMNTDMFVALVKLSFALGGIGKRSRKGNGHIMLSNTTLLTGDIHDIFGLIQQLNNQKFVMTGNLIEINPLNGISNPKYPFIRKIYFNKIEKQNEEEVRCHIDQIMGDYHSGLNDEQKKKYKANFGYIPEIGEGDKRKFASPVIFSILSVGSSYGLVATLLNTVEDKYVNDPNGNSYFDFKYQEEVAKKVLGL